MTREYNPLEHSVVQALLKPDATHQYETSDFVEALIIALKRELDLVYWNWNQESLDDRKDWQFTDLPGGFEYRRYYWDDEEEFCELPNMKFAGVSINWYKHIGRGMSTNVDFSNDQWVQWFGEALNAIRLYNVCMQVRHRYFRDGDAGREPFSTNEKVQCKDCKYCSAFGANALIWNRSGSRDVSDAE